MMRRLVAVALLVVAGCRFGGARAPAGQPAPPPLPAIPVFEIVTRSDTVGPVLAPSRSRDPLASITSTQRVTLTAVGADVRTLLLWLAEQAGASMVISPDVRARVTVSLRDVPVADAMRAVMAEAGLSVLVGPLEAPWGPVVFYQLPVNVNLASPEAIASRFGVSLELARFIVESRPVP